jgi:hypothetical protein
MVCWPIAESLWEASTSRQEHETEETCLPHGGWEIEGKGLGSQDPLQAHAPVT